MNLPSDFQFSQGSLQDFLDCRRRFQLRYIRRLAWPAVEIEPIGEYERLLQLGAMFHRLVQQQLQGIPTARLSEMIQDRDLGRWWENYLKYMPIEGAGIAYPERMISAPLRGHYLVAKYDLIQIHQGERAVIFDWKTTRKRPIRQYLRERMQTRLYPYLLVRAGAHLNHGKLFSTEQVEIIYWFADFPEKPERFVYDRSQYELDNEFLIELVGEIINLREDEFNLTVNETRCRFCPYRSLCERGIRAGDLADVEETEGLQMSIDFVLDFEQISEIEY